MYHHNMSARLSMSLAVLACSMSTLLIYCPVSKCLTMNLCCLVWLYFTPQCLWPAQEWRGKGNVMWMKLLQKMPFSLSPGSSVVKGLPVRLTVQYNKSTAKWTNLNIVIRGLSVWVSARGELKWRHFVLSEQFLPGHAGQVVSVNTIVVGSMGLVVTNKE